MKTAQKPGKISVRILNFMGIEFDKQINDGVRGKELIISKKRFQGYCNDCSNK